MIKKVLLILSVMLFAFSCSSPSNPDGNTGDGGSTGGGTGTTNPSEISAFLKDKTGVYGTINNNDYEENRLKIKNSTLYMVNYDIINKVEGNITYYKNDSKIVVKTTDDIYEYVLGNKFTSKHTLILKKEPYNKDDTLNEIGENKELSRFAGNYLYRNSTFIQIDSFGKVYFIDPTQFKVTLENNTLVLSVDNSSLRIDLSQPELLYKTFINGSELVDNLEKTDLLENYEGVYNNGGISLTIDNNGIINFSADSSVKVNNSRLRGNVITSTTHTDKGKEISTFTFSDDGNTVTYKPHQGLESTLTKQN